VRSLFPYCAACVSAGGPIVSCREFVVSSERALLIGAQVRCILPPFVLSLSSVGCDTPWECAIVLFKLVRSCEVVREEERRVTEGREQGV